MSKSNEVVPSNSLEVNLSDDVVLSNLKKKITLQKEVKGVD